MSWINYPRGGTSFGEGRWLCNVVKGQSVVVEILSLTERGWFRDCGKKLHYRETVTHVDWVPDPAGVPRPAYVPARIQAILSGEKRVK